LNLGTFTTHDFSAIYHDNVFVTRQVCHFVITNQVCECRHDLFTLLWTAGKDPGQINGDKSNSSCLGRCQFSACMR
jgi:hypothetical protein